MMCHTYFINHLYLLKVSYNISVYGHGIEVIKKRFLTIKNFTGVSAEIKTVSIHKKVSNCIFKCHMPVLQVEFHIDTIHKMLALCLKRYTCMRYMY